MTLAGAPAGFLPWLAADLARAGARAAPCSSRRTRRRCGRWPTPRIISRPSWRRSTFPAWDCLPYDRASPSLRVDVGAAGDAARAAAQGGQAAAARHHRQRRHPAHADAVPHPPAGRAARARRADRPRPAGRPALSANGYARTDTVARSPASSRCAAASSTCSRRARSRRCGSISSATRSRASAASIPATQRTIGTDRRLHPAARLRDAARRGQHQALPRPLSRAVRRHRDRRSALPGGVGRPPARRAGPLAALVRGAAGDPVRPSRPTTTSIVRDAGDAGAADARFEAIADYYENRDARADRAIPAATGRSSPRRSISPRDEWERLIAAAPAPPAPRRSTSRKARRCSTSRSIAARDFAPERRAGRQRLRGRGRACRRAAPREAARSCSPAIRPASRERLKGLLADHGLKKAGEVDSWQEALGAAAGSARSPSSRSTTASPRADVALLTEQDMLGDRLVRRRKRTKSADAFLDELATLTPGDLVVHADHGIGRYEGLTQIPVGSAPARLRRAGICRRRQALRPGREYRHPLALRQRERRAWRSTGSAARPGSGASRG